MARCACLLIDITGDRPGVHAGMAPGREPSRVDAAQVAVGSAALPLLVFVSFKPFLFIGFCGAGGGRQSLVYGRQARDH
jgi:hypothetical protein